MPETTVSCPECGAEIPLTEAVSHRLREQLDAERHKIADAARQQAAEAERLNLADKDNLIKGLYDHLCGTEFRQHIEAVVESFLGLKDQLESEQRAFARQWKERQHQLQKAITHTAMLYGGIQGIVGREALPGIKTLELPDTD